jgi:outer membrane lipoprotein SlyB
MSAFFRRAAAQAVFLLVVGLAGCATPAAVEAPATTGRSAAAFHGTIVSVRAIAPQAAAGDPRASIIGAIGARPGTAAAPAVEIIIRGDAGQTISVVQANDADYRVGQQITVTPGDHPRLIRS